MRGFALVLGLLVGVAFLGTACGSAAATQNQQVTITWWTSGNTPAQIKQIDAMFHKAHPNLHAQGQYIAQSDEELPKLIAALKSNTEPPVILDQNPSDLPLLAQSGKLIDLNGKLTAATNQLYPGIKHSLFYRGKQLGMALAGVGDLALFYNKSDFQKAGISSPPATWTQLQADAQKLTDPAAHQFGMYIPFGDAEFISYAWEPVLWGNGGTLLNTQQTKAEFDSPAGVKALTTWVDMVRQAKTAPDQNYATGGNYQGAPAFASNAAAMIIDGQWDVSTFTQAGVDYGIAPFPAGTKGPSTNLGIGVAALFKSSSAKEQAGLTFIKWLASPSTGAYLAAQGGGLPSSAAQLKEPMLKSYIAQNPTYSVFANMEEHGQVRPITPAYNAVSQALWTQINNALNGSVTPSAALKQAAQQANAALKSSGG
ncbi:MAG: extracellular solute-binding protein [Candidatus Dormibacteraceae bacterium]